MTADFSIDYRLKRKWMITGLIATLVIVLIIPFSYYQSGRNNQNSVNPDLKETAGFVGRESCRECHRNEYDKWTNSHHDRAMDLASDESVLGDFNNAEFTYKGQTTRFFKKDGLFFVNTPGPDGLNADFQITRTFGFYPLQQYLIPFDKGKFQALSIAWDDIKKRWYALPNYTSDHTDWLHWTGQSQNWNGMCAECHSTNLKKGYDHNNNSYKTTWSEIDVSCEACHGPASKHVSWASTPEMGRPDIPDAGLIVKTRDISSADLIQVCGRCHSRRAFIDDFSHTRKNLMDYMIPSLLSQHLYHPDGQISDEVYVYGSFMQSKMFSMDVKCSDCHDIHSLKLKHDGNDLCLSCHKKALYDTQTHHFHKKVYKGRESKGDDCISCHMPQATYMGIDNRADHSIRIPRPDLTQTLQVPNSCSTSECHGSNPFDPTLNLPLKSIIDTMAKWYGQKKRPHYGETISLAREGKLQALPSLISLSKDTLYPGIVRATALSLLSAYPFKESYTALENALADPDPLIRQTSISTINLLAFDKNATLIFPLLYDPVKAVRIQAALGVANLGGLKLSKEQKTIFESAAQEYIKANEYASDFASGRYNLGLIYNALGNKEKALENYVKAIGIDDLFIPAKNNLAMLYNTRGENKKAVQLFREILAAHPEMHDIAYSLGLLLVEEKKYPQAVTYLKKAATGLPERSRIQYNLGLLQQFLKNNQEAEQALLKALSLEPENFDYLFALADHYIKQNRLDHAQKAAQKIVQLYPENKTGHDLLNYIAVMKQKKSASQKQSREGGQ